MKTLRPLYQQGSRIARSRVAAVPSQLRPRFVPFSAKPPKPPPFPPLWSRAFQTSRFQADHSTENTQSSASNTSASPGSSSLELPSNESGSPSSRRPDFPRADPHYELTFTCKPCNVSSSHNISKHGYHKGTIVVSCPSCKSRHIISDHLKIFMDEPSDLEDIMRQHGGLVKKGTLGTKDGQDVEFWEDGSETVREKKEGKEGSQRKKGRKAQIGS